MLNQWSFVKKLQVTKGREAFSRNDTLIDYPVRLFTLEIIYINTTK